MRKNLKLKIMYLFEKMDWMPEPIIRKIHTALKNSLNAHSEHIHLHSLFLPPLLPFLPLAKVGVNSNRNKPMAIKDTRKVQQEADRNYFWERIVQGFCLVMLSFGKHAQEAAAL